MYPRYELVDEFRRKSGGQSFHMVKFSRFLELYGATNEVVEEIKKEENSLIITRTAARALNTPNWIDGAWRTLTAIDRNLAIFLESSDFNYPEFREQVKKDVEILRKSISSIPLGLDENIYYFLEFAELKLLTIAYTPEFEEGLREKVTSLIGLSRAGIRQVLQLLPLD